MTLCLDRTSVQEPGFTQSLARFPVVVVPNRIRNAMRVSTDDNTARRLFLLRFGKVYVTSDTDTIVFCLLRCCTLSPGFHFEA